METVKDFLKTIDNIDKHKIYFSNHFDQRMAERIPETNKHEIIRMINDVDKNITDGDYLIFSKSLNFGVVVAKKKDKFTAITILPKGKDQAKLGTEKIVVGSFYTNPSKEFLNYIESLKCSEKTINQDYSEKEIYVDNYRIIASYIDNKFLELKQCNIIEVN